MYRSRKAIKNYKPEATMKEQRSGSGSCPFCFLENNTLKLTKHNAVIENTYGYQYWESMHVVEHLMIIPFRHIESIQDLTDQEKIDTINLIAEYEAKGFNVYARERDNTHKSIPHQHTHLIKTANQRASFVLYIKKPYILWRR